MSNTLSKIWLAFVGGDEEAFSTFYKSNYNMLYSYGISLSMDEQLIHDIIQDLFLKLYTTPATIKNTLTIRPFLIKSVRNIFLNHLKVQKRNVDIDQIEHFELKYQLVDNHFEKKEEEEEMAVKLQDILSNLTARQKEIIYLRFIHQMEYEDIANIMEITQQGARNLVSRAMSRIREDNLIITTTISHTLLTINIISSM